MFIWSELLQPYTWVKYALFEMPAVHVRSRNMIAQCLCIYVIEVFYRYDAKKVDRLIAVRFRDFVQE